MKHPLLACVKCGKGPVFVEVGVAMPVVAGDDGPEWDWDNLNDFGSSPRYDCEACGYRHPEGTTVEEAVTDREIPG